MTKGMDLIFSLFDVPSALEVPFGILQCIMDLPKSSFEFHSFLLIVKNVDLVVACDGSWKSYLFFIATTLITELLF